MQLRMLGLFSSLLCLTVASSLFASVQALVTNSNSSNVSVIDTTTQQVIATVGVGTQPLFSAVTPSGNKAYVTNFGSGTVSVINTQSDVVTTTITLGASPGGPAFIAITPDGSKVYVRNEETSPSLISVIDTTTDAIIATITVGNSGPELSYFAITRMGASSIPLMKTITQ